MVRNLTAEKSAEFFRDAKEDDRADYITDSFLERWLFAERLYERGLRKEMSFFEYQGPKHIIKYLRWIDRFDYVDWFGKDIESLAELSVARDRACVEALSLPGLDRVNIEAIGTYNAQDYRLQRFYPIPHSMRPRTILDFGAGHGRMANLAFSPADETTELMIAVDGIEGSYLTQRAYYTGLGLQFADYIDERADKRIFDFADLAAKNQLLHLPTWRFDLIPDATVDLVCCVQVLRELPRRLTALVIEQFGRVVKPRGAVYVRDHLQGHNPNNMPIDKLLLANGFVPEFTPQIRDQAEMHGVPRIWRKLDPELYFDIES